MLFLVSTPIGNLSDITLRGKEILQSVDLIACEDTRTTKQLMTLLGLKCPPLTPYHEHNADEARPALIDKLKKGVNIALVSDAGTPLISDPGYRLVREAQELGLAYTTVPGANAVLSALQLSGLPSDNFYFGGFLPHKSVARQNALNGVKNLAATLIFYETPHRLQGALDDILRVLGNRQMAVVREITKKFEEAKRMPVSDFIDFYAQNGAPKGELVLVIDRPHAQDDKMNEDDIKRLIIQTLQNASLKDTAELVAGMTGIHKKQIYKMALDIQNEKN